MTENKYWRKTEDRICVSCGSSFAVQLQTVRAGGGLYCSRKCIPNHNIHLKKYIKNSLGPENSYADIKCPSCELIFKVRIKNINRGGGKYCSKRCNPAYAAKYDKATKQRRYNLMASYGLTTVEYDLMLEKQKGVCAICGSKPRDLSESKHARLHVDHDHSTGKVRELLCASCNRALGWFREDKIILRNAINYLSKHEINNQADALALLHCVMGK